MSLDVFLHSFVSKEVKGEEDRGGQILFYFFEKLYFVFYELTELIFFLLLLLARFNGHCRSVEQSTYEQV